MKKYCPALYNVINMNRKLSPIEPTFVEAYLGFCLGGHIYLLAEATNSSRPSYTILKL